MRFLRVEVNKEIKYFSKFSDFEKLTVHNFHLFLNKIFIYFMLVNKEFKAFFWLTAAFYYPNSNNKNNCLSGTFLSAKLKSN